MNIIITKSIITCPSCGFQKEETMSEDSCQFFYECEKCKIILKPRVGDCCVYCSFGNVSCPPIKKKINMASSIQSIADFIDEATAQFDDTVNMLDFSLL
jgi:hypothetical protein